MKKFLVAGLLVCATNAFGQGGSTVSDMNAVWDNAGQNIYGRVSETRKRSVPAPPLSKEMHFINPNDTEDFDSSIQLDSDHEVLTDNYDCEIPADYYSGNSDTECAYEPTDVRFAEDGSFRHNAWNLYYRVISGSIWKKIVKNIKSRIYAKLDAYCGTNGGIAALTTWVNNQGGPALCGTNACNNRFNATNLPTCNAGCNEAVAANCGGSCDLESIDGMCSGTPASVCATWAGSSCGDYIDACIITVTSYQEGGNCRR